MKSKNIAPSKMSLPHFGPLVTENWDFSLFFLGHVDTPVDESLLLRNRLVDSHGIISSSAFYNYLTAWYSNDAMAYTHSQASIVPQPKLWLHNAMDHGLLVPKSKPIAFARIPFYLSNLGDTEVMVEMINQVCNLSFMSYACHPVIC